MATTKQNPPADVLSGAARARRYHPAPVAEVPQDPTDPQASARLGPPADHAELDEEVSAVPTRATSPAPETRPRRPAGGAQARPRRSSDPATVAPARWGWRGSMARWSAGLVKLQPTSDELTYRKALATIRQTTFPRAVNIFMTNPKGGVGKTPCCLIMGGVLGHIRGGYVTVWEAAESAGTLSRRAEGNPQRGLEHLLKTVPSITSAGKLGGYVAPQTSHADVIGSIGARGELSAADVFAVRELLDTYARITLTDTGNNPHHEVYRAALNTADIVVVPCTISEDALNGVEDVLHVLDTAGGRISDDNGLASRVMVVLSHDGGPERKGLQAEIEERLRELYVPFVEVPFDPAIRQGGEIVLGDLSEESTRAWTEATAMAVTLLDQAELDTDLVAEQRRVLTLPA